MKKRISTALATLSLFALSLPVLVFAQQSSTQPPPPPAPRRGDAGRPNDTAPAPAGRARRQPRIEATEGIEADVAEALTVIQEHHADGNKLDYNGVFKSSIIGMLRSLDPHSNFYDAKEFEEQRADWRSEYYGIGATIGDRKVGASTDTYILATFEGTPAFRAGLRFGDKIVEIDGQSVKGKPSGEVRDRLRGPRGTTVRVTVERASTGQKETAEITRDAVAQPTVPDAYFLRPGVGYIDMTRGFNYTTADEFVHALEELRARGMQGLVLDLRGNGGGILDQAVRVAERFLSNGQLILTQRGRGARGGGNRPYQSENRNPDATPLVVLVNRGTASASEIVAGALQDHDRALIVGETSFGKGLVQSILPLEYGTALTLTTSKYYTPSGRLIQRDYSNTGFYDYIFRGGIGAEEPEPAAEPPKGPESKTDTGRTIYGGGGIAPDEAVKARTLNPVQIRIIDPVFAFARELVNGRVAGLTDYKVKGMPEFEHNLEATDFVVDDRVFRAFKEYVARNGEHYKLTDAQLDRQREYIARQLRYDMATAAYGSVKATQVLVGDDPQVSKAVELLPRARELAAAAQRGRNPQTKSFE
ncbi:MAG TPA: S41 family peptidase [Pyrinomonadaceae bacterium]|nr:S41 family peptidase [Pyrinomonadaceae bacterium]